MRIKVGSVGLVGMVVCALFIGGAARAEGPTYAQLPQPAPAVLEATAVEGKHVIAVEMRPDPATFAGV